MTSTDRRIPPSRRRRPPPRRRGGGGGWVALLVLLVVLGALAWLLLGGGFDQLAGGEGPSEDEVAEPVDVSLDDLLERAETNDDGSVTVTLSEGEVGGLMGDALSQGSSPTLEDVTVDLQEPDSSAPGQMELAGRLPDRDLPVTAVIDLRVDDGEVRPNVRDVRVGPLPVPDGLAADLNTQLQDVGLLAGRGISVEELETSGSELEVTGRQG